MAKGRYDAAEEAFKKGTAIDPQNANARFHQCLNGLARGDWKTGPVACQTFTLFAPANDHNRQIAERVSEQLVKLSGKVFGR